MRVMRCGRILLAIVLGMSFLAWGQGGSSQAGRGAAAPSASPQQTGAPGSAAQRGGGGGRGGGGSSGPGDFYTYDTSATAGIPIPDMPPVETRQKVSINGEPLAYTARAGFLPLRNPTTGQAEAHLFFTSYTKDGGGDASARPLMFFLSGAPGVAAGWQEFGGLGPKGMQGIGGADAGQPPFGWTDNPHTLLVEADLVFVNPVGTAWSRPDQPGRGPSYWNTATDIASLGEFVRAFLAKYDRRNSPLFLAGEDFVTGRTAGLAVYLSEHHIPVLGVALLSMMPSADAVAGDAQYINVLPSMILAAWHHKKLAPELLALSAPQIGEQARQFASRDYLHALYKGDRMTAEDRAVFVANMARLTGLSKAFLLNNNLRIPLDRFQAELLRDQRRTLSGSDARVAGAVPPSGGRGGGGGGFGGGAAPVVFDFNQARLSAGFLTAYETYLRRELGFGGVEAGPFYLSGGGIGAFTVTGNDDANLSAAFLRNPNLRLFVGANYFDLNAPFFATEFTVAHLGVSPEVRARNITVRHFEAGQMAYVEADSSAQLCAELIEFIVTAVSAARG